MVLTGKPEKVSMSFSETIEIMADSELMDQIRKGLKEIEEGKTRSWEEVKTELDL